MIRKVSVLDYGAGNLFSVCRAIEECDAQPIIITTAEEVMKSEALIFPGVGAFPSAVKSLHEQQLWGSLKEFPSTGRPFMGICLGMQMMMSSSNEFHFCEGLGLIEGQVSQIPTVKKDGNHIKVPSIGWFPLEPTEQIWSNTILHNIPINTSYFYFVHSFQAQPKNPADLLAYYTYEEQKISAIIHKDNIYGCQFHPERSGKLGLKVLKNFLTQ